MTDRRYVQWGRLVASVVAVVLLAGGCSDDGDDDSTTPEPPTRAGAPILRQDPARLDVSIARLSGAVPKPVARDLTKHMGGVVASWFGGAFLPGDYPRTSFAGYASFTPDAARLARRSSGVTSNVRLGERWVQVVPTRQRVRLFVFAPGHRPSGATAQVELVLVGIDSAGATAELAVTGELYLTRTDRGWRIFGFDLSRSVGEPGDFVARQSAERDVSTGKPDGDLQKRHAQRQEEDR